MYHSIPRISGVYQILCTANSKIYIGSAWDMRKRVRQHVADLNAGRHRNPHLQRAWSRYGPEQFTCTVLEEADRSIVREREQHYLDSLQVCDDRYGFNIAPGVNNQIVSPETRHKIAKKKRGHAVSAETRAKLSAANVGKPGPNQGRKWSETTRKKIGLGQRGRQQNEAQRVAATRNLARSPEREAARLSGVVKSYRVTSPDGSVYDVTNLSGFCREHGLGGGLHRVATGARKQYKGWRCESR